MTKYKINPNGTVEYDGKTYTYNTEKNQYIRYNKRDNAVILNDSIAQIIHQYIETYGAPTQSMEISKTELRSGGFSGNPVYEINGNNYTLSKDNKLINWMNNEDYTGAKSGDIVYNGETYTMEFTSGHGIKRNQAAVLEYFKKYGRMPTDKAELDIGGTGNFNEAVTEVKKWLQENGIYDTYMNDFKATDGFTKEKTVIDPNTGEELDPNSDRARQLNLENAQDILYNSYWNNIYQKDREGTLGNEAYNELLTAEQNAAQNTIDLSNLQSQQLAMAQAQTVKNITDQLKAERMSMLRSGMSESQIASQDMQQMIANTNALNEQIAASNLGVVQGRQQYANAQQTAYQNWLNSMNQTATNAAAMAAADTGDLYQQTLKRMKATGESFNVAQKNVGGNTGSTTK